MQLFKYINHDEWITEETPYAKFDEQSGVVYSCWDDTENDVRVQRTSDINILYAVGAWDDRLTLLYKPYTLIGLSDNAIFTTISYALRGTTGNILYGTKEA